MALTQILSGLDGLWWLLLFLGPLLISQRSLHRELQAIFFILTRSPALALGLFSFLFFPGVLLHEGSHFVMAMLLGVHTGRVSLLPKPVAGGKKLQLGFVETASAGMLRDALIGAAPLISGGILVAYIGLVRLDLTSAGLAMLQGKSLDVYQAVLALVAKPDFWLWFYLSFVISSTMLPSASDRRAWLPVGGVIIGFFLLIILLGAGSWLAIHIEPAINQVLRGIAGVFAISLVLHVLCWLPSCLIRLLLSRLTGIKLT
jgi:hypothetical protein